MNTEYKKLLLESLEKVHQAINKVEPVEPPSLVHTEIEIITSIEKADLGDRTNNNLNGLLKAIQSRINRDSFDELSF